MDTPLTKNKPPEPRRVLVEKCIYLRYGKGPYEIGYRDYEGKQRWHTIEGDIEEARRVREELHVGRGRNQRITRDLLRVAKLAESLSPHRYLFVETMRATNGMYPYKAWLKLSALALAMARRCER